MVPGLAANVLGSLLDLVMLLCFVHHVHTDHPTESGHAKKNMPIKCRAPKTSCKQSVFSRCFLRFFAKSLRCS